MASKGKAVKFSTFKSWGIPDDVIGFKTIVEEGATLVNFVWCKICSKYKGCILRHPAVKGATKVAAETYINGTNVVTKFAVSYFYHIWRRGNVLKKG